MSTYYKTGLVLATFLWFISSVRGALYATSPISSTVWSASRSQVITWTDDAEHPTLAELGKLDIELFVGKDKHVATLGRGVHPEEKHFKTKVDPAWGHNGSDYNIRFVSTQPVLTIYTADFTITNMAPKSLKDSTSKSTHNGKFVTRTSSTFVSTATANDHFQSGPYTYPTSSLPNSSKPPSSQETTPVSSFGSSDGEGQARSRPLTSNSGPASKRIDYEKLKFRIVFILWPAVIGLTMAL
ncbi:hypothetical protein K474DRAFT_1638964 [Panus rudis PR-1116 ss-1]|nr:hypothetical protein K474DRAFT_1638964 [Panus rudis PR-1116 ss-1]